MKFESDDDDNCTWCAWKEPQGLGKEAGRIGNQKMSQNLPNYSNDLTGQNTEKNSGDFSELLWKTLNSRNYITIKIKIFCIQL